MRNLMAGISLLFLSACASAPPITVEPDRFDDYWLLDTSPRLEMLTPDEPTTACVAVEFTVASSGEPQQVSAVATSHEEGPFVDAALAQVRAQRFKPAPGNSARTPARTRRIVSWVWEDQGQDNKAILAKCAP